MAARAVLALIAIATVIGLTACASATHQAAATGQTSPGASLCTNDQGVDRVVVSPASSPHEITLHGATQVRALATALCTLPPMASGQSCPAASGGSVRLVFTAGEQGFPPVSVQESGCRRGTGARAGPAWSASSPVGQ